MDTNNIHPYFRGDFEENFQLRGRYDGKINLWRRFVQTDEEGENFIWQVIGVFASNEEAKRMCDSLREKKSN